MSQDLLLSQDLSNLMLGVSEPAQATVSEPAQTKVTAPVRFDFRDFQRLSPQQLSRMRERHEGAMHSLGAVFSSLLHTTIEAGLEGTDSLPSPSLPGAGEAVPYLATLRRDGGLPMGFMALSWDFVSLLLDLLLGGSGKQTLPLSRPLTEIEKPLLHSVLERVLAELAPCWEDLGVGAIHVEGSGGGSNTVPQNLRGGPVVEIMLRLKWEHVSHVLQIVLLADAFHGGGGPVTERKSLSAMECLRNASLLLQRLEKSPLHVEACLRGLSISVLDLLALQPGDILVFDCPRTQPAELLINGSLRFLGGLVPSQGRKAFQIEYAVKRSGTASAT